MIPTLSREDLSRGDDWPLVFYNITNEDGTLATSLAGWTFFFTLKALDDSAANDSAALISKSVGSGITVVGLEVQVNVTSTDTAALVPGTTYKWDFQVKTAAGRIYTSQRGTVRIVDDVTKRTS